MPKLDDLTGQIFGKLKVIERAPGTGGRTRWSCECSCGRVKTVMSINLKRGSTRSCGCLVHTAIKNRNDARTHDFTGKRFGRLIAINRETRGQTSWWSCRCDCGNTVKVAASKLHHKRTKSCGCYRRDFRKKPSDQVGFTRLIEAYKHSARRKGIDWSLPDENFKKLTQSPCKYCNAEPSKVMKSFRRIAGPDNHGYKYNGVDRVDSRKGYSIDNTVSCCSDCNWMKNDLSLSGFMSQVEKIYRHSIEGHS